MSEKPEPMMILTLPIRCQDCDRELVNEDAIVVPGGARMEPRPEGGPPPVWRCRVPCLSMKPVRPDQEPLTLEWECSRCGTKQETQATVTERAADWTPLRAEALCPACALPFVVGLPKKEKP